MRLTPARRHRHVDSVAEVFRLDISELSWSLTQPPAMLGYTSVEWTVPLLREHVAIHTAAHLSDRPLAYRPPETGVARWAHRRLPPLRVARGP